MLSYPRIIFCFGSKARKQRPENVGAVAVVRLLFNNVRRGRSVRPCSRASCGLCAVYGRPDVTFRRGCADH